jgi:hypothetical protein
MFNGGIRGKRANDNQGTVNPQSKFVQTKSPQPYISGYTLSGIDDTQLDPAGGQTVLINGTGFATGISATLGGTQIGAVTLVSPTQISFTTPAKSAGSYTLVVYNSAGGAAILVPGLTYSSVPTYTTAAGSIGSYYETTAISTSVVATSDSALTYSLSSGSLPSGASLSSGGVITGTSPVDSGSTTYTFAITATDAELQDVTRTFTLTINTDVVTWSSPASGTAYSLTGNQAMSNVTLSATSAAGYGVTYTANALPTGVTLSSGTISGTPTVEQTVSTLLTATAATTGRSATRTVSWTVSLGDTYFKYVSLLLNGSTTTTTFINDASLNNNQLTIFGDTKPTLFTPYSDGYYTAMIDASGQNFSNTSFAGSNFGTGNFTVEMWLHWTTTASGNTTSVEFNGSSRMIIGRSTTGFRFYVNTTEKGFNYTIALNTWYHIAIVKISGTIVFYVNGVSQTSFADAVTWAHTTLTVGRNSDGQEYGQVNISNLRVVTGTGVYTGAFTPPTNPLQVTQSAGTNIAAITTGTTLLAFRSNRFIDISPLNTVLVVAGVPNISPMNPFSTPTTSSYNTLYSTYFDGTGDYLSVPSNTQFALSSDFTVELWVYSSIAWAATRNFVNTNSGGFFLQYVVGTGLQIGVAGSAATATFTTTLSSNTWYHIAVTRSSGSNKCFVNGVQVGSTVTESTSYAQNGMYIGALWEGSQPLTGHISNLRVIKGTALYTSTFTPSTTPLTAISGTSLLTCQNSTLIDNSTNAFTITSNGDARPIAVSPFTQTTSSTTLTSLGSAYFDGTGDYLTVPYSTNWDWASTNYTIDVWCHPTALSTYNPLVVKEISSGNNDWELVINSSGTVTFRYYNGAVVSFSTTNKVTLNTWNHVAFVNNSSALSIYINGILSATATTSGTPATSTSVPLQIGTTYGGISGASSAYFTGYISDVRVTKGTALYKANFLPPSTPLTAVANTQLLTCQYNGGATNQGFYDNSSFNTIMTRAGNATQGTFSPYSQAGWSGYFDGTGNFQTSSGSTTTMFGGTGLLTSSSVVTIEGWMYETSRDATPDSRSMFGDFTPGSASNIWGLGTNASGYLCFNYYNGSVQTATSSTTFISLNTWTHFAVVISATSLKLFVNGTLQTISGTTTMTGASSTVGYLAAGGWNSNTTNNRYLGYLSNIRVLSGTALYSTTFTPPTNPLTAIANTKLLVAQSSGFFDNGPNNFKLTLRNTPSIQAFSPFGSVGEATPLSYSNYFNGSTDYLNVATSTQFGFGTGDFTVEFWAYPTVNARQDWIDITNGTQRVLVYYSGSAITFYSVPPNSAAITGPAMTLNTWQHIAVSKQSGSTKMFVNGTQVGSTYASSQDYGTTNAVTIGKDSAGSTYVTGYISNVRIVKGTALYTTNFTPSTTPLTAVSGTSLLTCQSTTIIDNSTNAFTVTSNGSPKVYKYNPFGYTAQSPTSYTPTLHGGSAYFDGSGDYVYNTTTSVTKYLTGDFTVEYWVYLTYDNGGGFQTHVGSSLDSSSIAFGTPGTLYITWTTQNVGGGPGNTNLKLKQWYHIAWVRIGTAIKGYLNGVQDYSSTLSTSMTSPGFSIGAQSNGGYPFGGGYISDIRISNGVGLYKSNFVPPTVPVTATSTTSLLMNMTGGGIVDAHGSNLLETIGNTQLASEDPYSGSYYSNYFNGSTDYLSFTGLTIGTNAYTIEFWFNINNFTTAYAFLSTSNSNALDFRINNATTFAIDQQNVAQTTFTVPTMSTGVWYHVAVVRNASNVCTVFLNGTRSSTGSVTMSTNYSAASNYIGLIGTNYFPGYISNLRVSNGSALYDPTQSTITVPIASLTAISGTSLLTCQSNKFIDNSSNALTITRTGSPTVKSFNPFQNNSGKSLYFDGTADRLSILDTPNINLGTGDFTLECWAYFNVVNAEMCLINKGWQSSSAYASYLIYMTSAGSLRFNASTNGGTWDIASEVVIATMTSGSWTHIAVTRSDTTYRAFINGVIQPSFTFTNSGSHANIAAQILFVGGRTDTASSMNGYLIDVRITKGYARYTATFTPPTSAVQAR